MDKPTLGKWKAQKLVPDKHGIIDREAWEIYTPEYDVAIYIPRSGPIRKEADAELIVALQNAAVSINPTNPMAVTKNMAQVMKALESAGAFIIHFGGERHLADAPENCAHCHLIKNINEALSAIQATGS